ncbi:MAG: Calx-beta domain-containing protein [Candidatus Berkelbacteria bacterium]
MQTKDMFVFLSVLVMLFIAAEAAFGADKSKSKLPTMTVEELRWSESAEDGKMNVIVKLDKRSDEPATVYYRTVDLEAIAGSDYTATTGMLTIPPGEMEGQILIPIIDDKIAEPDEKFILCLSYAKGANISPAHGSFFMTITNDDPVPDFKVFECRKVKEEVLLDGICTGEKPDRYRVVVYLKRKYPAVGWKEAFSYTRLLEIGKDGKWSTRVPVNFDNEITDAAVFLVNDDFVGPKHDEGRLPDLINYKTINNVYIRCKKYYE